MLSANCLAYFKPRPNPQPTTHECSQYRSETKCTRAPERGHPSTHKTTNAEEEIDEEFRTHGMSIHLWGYKKPAACATGRNELRLFENYLVVGEFLLLDELAQTGPRANEIFNHLCSVFLAVHGNCRWSVERPELLEPLGAGV